MAIEAAPPKVVVRVPATAHPLRHPYRPTQATSSSSSSTSSCCQPGSTCTRIGQVLRVFLLSLACLLLVATQLAVLFPNPDQYELAERLDFMRGFHWGNRGQAGPQACDNPFLQDGDIDLRAWRRAARAWRRSLLASAETVTAGAGKAPAMVEPAEELVGTRAGSAKDSHVDTSKDSVQCSNVTCIATLLPPLVQPAEAGWAWDRLDGVLTLNPGAVLQSTSGPGGGECTVYSLGLGGDVEDEGNAQYREYEHAVLRASKQCTVHTFDCTLPYPPMTHYPVRHSFHSTCLQGQQGDKEGQSLFQAMSALGHAGVELMRIDVEGAESALIDGWYRSWMDDPVGTALPMQISMEVHTMAAVQGMARQLVRMGYVPVAVEEDTSACEEGQCGEMVWVRAVCDHDTQAVLRE